MKVTVDWETANPVCDLKVAGAYAYWEHPKTEVLCLCAIPDRGPPATWIPGTNDAILSIFRYWAADPDVVFECHGAGFEQAGFEYVLVRRFGFPRLPPERWDDTMARCFYRGLPGGLDKAVTAIGGLSEQKDMEGSKLTISLSRTITQVAWMARRPPQLTQAEWKRQFPGVHYDRSPETIRRVADYCLQDCRTEIALGAAVGPLSPYERKVWVLDQKINQRGLKIDLDYVRACQAIVAEAKKPLLAEFDRLTGGLAPTQVGQLLKWVNEQGFPALSISKDALKSFGIVGLEEDLDDDELPQVREVPQCPEQVRIVLGIRSVLGSASIAKLNRMLQCVNSDGRIRYTQQYHGAHTGRTAGRLIQPTNFPRGKIDGGHDPDALVRTIMVARNAPKAACEIIGALYGDPIAAVASGLRHAVVAGDGNLFDTGDFAGIEARVVLALAGQYDKVELMASGYDVYLDMAEDIYRRPKGSWALDPRTPDFDARIEAIKKAHVPERTIGKNTVLGAGFGMGWAKFKDRYCQDQTDDFAKSVIRAYREVWAPKVPTLWWRLEEAALKAVRDQGIAEAYGIRYRWTEGWLACDLPDGQILWYRQPEYHPNLPMPWDPTDRREAWSYWAMKGGRWQQVKAYGGLLCENAVQKLARGFLVAASERLEAEGFPLVLTVYDECMSEVPAMTADKVAYEQIMAEPTPYAQSIRVPIEVEAWEGERYRK